ncbi:MAG: hypothetical protein JSR76_03340 [Verrucomicrobia bacterium]|nr:hypothetical protein [Verrucomicrobiota bacterium]
MVLSLAQEAHTENPTAQAVLDRLLSLPIDPEMDEITAAHIRDLREAALHKKALAALPFMEKEA